MPRSPNASFIHELPLRLNKAQVHAVNKRMDVAHCAYNVVLQEMLSRLQALRDDAAYASALAMPKRLPEQRAVRAEAFKALRLQHRFSEYEAHECVARHIRASGYLGDLIDSHVAQTLASRAFNAVQAYSVGLRGKPRFKRRGQIASVQGKGPTSALKWQDDRLVWGGKRRDRRLTLRPIFDHQDKQGVQAHALMSTIKYVRLVRRVIQGQQRFFVQLVCEGQPKARYEAKDGVVGLDLGPSSVAVVSQDKAELTSLLPRMREDLKAKRRLQRAMDRSRRATNPQCFNADGTWRKGARVSVRSARYQALRRALSEQERVMVERRERAQGHLANRILKEHGRLIKTEKLSLLAWQKMWGRRMKATAPASLMDKLRRKAANAGGALVEFNATQTKLSQYDHTQRDFVKKPLSLRWHVLRDGSGQVVQRDLYSAYLARFVEQNSQADELDASQAKQAWAVAHPLLEHAASRSMKTAQASSRSQGASPGAARPPEGVRGARMLKQSECMARSAAAEASCATL